MLSPSKVKRIIELRAEGRTYLLIASTLRITRGTVAGVLRRTKPKETPMTEPPEPVLGSTTQDMPAAPTLVWSAKGLLDLKPGECRYSTSTADDEDGYAVFLFCADPAVGGKPYCAFHASLCSAPARAPTTGHPASFQLPRLR
jgi:hypothetical protein